MDNKAIGQRIKALRKEQHLNQSEFAEKIGKSLRTVQKYENGEIEVSISVVSDIARVLNSTTSYIFGYETSVSGIQKLSDIMDFLFKLENIAGVDFNINVKKPPQDEQWECSISFSGNSDADYNADLCLFLERWAEEREKFSTYFSSLEAYKAWKEETLAYYAESYLQSQEPQELDFETRMNKRKEYMESILKKNKQG